MFGRDYRAQAFSSLNQTARHNPFPPPAAATTYTHSRTSSFTHNPQTQLPAAPPSAPTATGSGASLNLRNNPYAHKDPPTGPSPLSHNGPLSSIQTRTEQDHSHNQYTQFHQDHRREAAFDRFRERDRERERPSDAIVAAREQWDQQQQQQQQQQHREQVLAQQHRYGGPHTPPVTQPQFVPPDRSGPTPVSAHSAYATPLQGGPPSHPLDSRAHQQLQYEQELRRRDYERERQRQERMEQEARHRQEVQAQREAQRAYGYHGGWEPPPPNTQQQQQHQHPGPPPK